MCSGEGCAGKSRAGRCIYGGDVWWPFVQLSALDGSGGLRRESEPCGVLLVRTHSASPVTINASSIDPISKRIP